MKLNYLMHKYQYKLLYLKHLAQNITYIGNHFKIPDANYATQPCALYLLLNLIVRTSVIKCKICLKIHITKHI